jgi:hypothetical protein
MHPQLEAPTTQPSLDAFCGDNLEVQRSREAASADLIYVGQPFGMGKRPYYWPPTAEERTESMFQL